MSMSTEFVGEFPERNRSTRAANITSALAALTALENMPTLNTLTAKFAKQSERYGLLAKAVLSAASSLEIRSAGWLALHRLEVSLGYLRDASLVVEHLQERFVAEMNNPMVETVIGSINQIDIALASIGADKLTKDSDLAGHSLFLVAPVLNAALAAHELASKIWARAEANEALHELARRCTVTSMEVGHCLARAPDNLEVAGAKESLISDTESGPGSWGYSVLRRRRSNLLMSEQNKLMNLIVGTVQSPMRMTLAFNRKFPHFNGVSLHTRFDWMPPDLDEESTPRDLMVSALFKIDGITSVAIDRNFIALHIAADFAWTPNMMLEICQHLADQLFPDQVVVVRLPI